MMLARWCSPLEASMLAVVLYYAYRVVVQPMRSGMLLLSGVLGLHAALVLAQSLCSYFSALGCAIVGRLR